jgi:hypothetical protein
MYTRLQCMPFNARQGKPKLTSPEAKHAVSTHWQHKRLQAGRLHLEVRN